MPRHYGRSVSLTTWKEWGFDWGGQTLLLFHKHRELRVLVHGDNYASVGDLDGFRWLQEQFEAKLKMKTVVGHSGLEGVVTEGKILAGSSAQRMGGGSTRQTRDMLKYD